MITPPPLRLMMLVNVFPPIVGGAGVVYENLCRRLNGDNLIVVTPRFSYLTCREIPSWRKADHAHRFAVRRVKLLRPPMRPATGNPILKVWRHFFVDILMRARIKADVLREINKYRPQVICLGELFAMAWLGPVLRRAGIPLVQYVHGDEISEWTRSRTYAREASALLREAAAVIAVSSFARDEVLKRGAISERVHVITNGVDTGRFSPGHKSQRVLRLHAIQDRKLLLSITRLEERKGVDLVIRALPRLLISDPSITYLVVGDGSYRPRLESIAREAGVAHRVIFCGAISHDSEELIEYYRTADIFVLPNRKLASGEAEGFGLVFLEASSCGKPVIGGKTGGVPDAVDDGQTGVLVSGESAEEFAEAVERILRNPDLAYEMGKRGRDRSLACTWERKAEAFRSICSSVTEKEDWLPDNTGRKQVSHAG